MKKMKQWFFKNFSKMDHPGEVDYILIMIMTIIAMFFVVWFYIFMTM